MTPSLVLSIAKNAERLRLGDLREGVVAMSTHQRKENAVRRFRLRGIRLTPSLVISMIALFVALSGTGYAQKVVPLARRCPPTRPRWRRML